MGSGFVSNAIAALKNNARMLGRRNTLSQRASGINAQYGEFKDHKKMKGHEFAEFQKEIFEQNTRNRRRFRLVFWSSMIAVAIVLIYILFIYEVAPLKPLK